MYTVYFTAIASKNHAQPYSIRVILFPSYLFTRYTTQSRVVRGLGALRGSKVQEVENYTQPLMLEERLNGYRTRYKDSRIWSSDVFTPLNDRSTLEIQ